MVEARGAPVFYAPAERIYRAARDASDSVAVLLLLARSPQLIESTPISIAEMAQEEVARYQNLVSHKPVSLSYGGGADFSICASRKLVSAAIGNLIRNACQYTDQGSVTVHIEQRTVLIRDTGPGLPAPIRAMLSNDSCTTQFAGSAGTGLGLALVKRICEYLGATLCVADGLDNGTVFNINFANDLTKF